MERAASGRGSGPCPRHSHVAEVGMIRSHSRRGYSAAQKWLHWGMALLVAILAAVGLAITRLGEGTVTGALYELHKSIGLSCLRSSPPGWLSASRAACRRRSRASRPGSSARPAPALWSVRPPCAVPLAGWTATSSCCGPSTCSGPCP